MSHFAVAVIVHDNGYLDDLLAPYQENNMGDCPEQYLKFVSTEEEHREEYENHSTDKIRTPDGRLLWEHDEEFRVPGSIGHGSNTHKVPEGMGYEKVTLKFAELYPTFDAFMKEYHGSSGPDEETGKYGYWENPNAKWDWWQIGGRYSGWFRTKEGKQVNDCQFKNLDLSRDEEAYKKAIRFWEIVVEGAELRPGEEKPVNFYRESYYTEQFGSKENYAEDKASPAPWAFITADGVWHENGTMGWFACSDATLESRKAYKAEWDAAIAAADPEDWIVIVDCHI